MAKQKVNAAVALRTMIVIGAMAGALISGSQGAMAARAPRDTDRDGLTNQWEIQVSLTDPRDADTDDDRIPDGKEDADLDTLRNRVEQGLGTNPNDADTDDDSLDDGDEVGEGTDPNDPDSDDDGIDDGDDADDDCTAPSVGSSRGASVDSGSEDDGDDDPSCEDPSPSPSPTV